MRLAVFFSGCMTPGQALGCLSSGRYEQFAASLSVCASARPPLNLFGDCQVKPQIELRQLRAILTIRMRLVDGRGSGHSELIDQGDVGKVSHIDLVIMEK
jgi:hypothetical protein